MEIFLDCLPCMLKQVLGASRMATNHEKIREKILIDSSKILSNYKQFRCSPELALAMHDTVKTHTKKNDPYDIIKENDIKTSLKIYPMLKSFLDKNNNSLYNALKISATGNIIDSAVYNDLDIESCVENELNKDFGICDIEIFMEKLKDAKTLLIIGDNSGETVFDKVLIEYLSPLKVTYAVRSAPIINDATIEDAKKSGLDECSTIISTGCNAPGAVLKRCNKEFLDIFNSSDIVISKGQGNYEALSDCEREVFFMLNAKCPVVSNKIGVDLYSYVFMRHDPHSNRLR